MRFPFRRRRTQVRSGPTPAVTHSATGKPLVYTNVPSTTVTATNWRTAISPPSPAPQTEEAPVPELSARERKLYRVSTKREQRTAGQLAVRAGLQSADGSGRGVVRDLNALVKAGKLTRHGAKTPYSYTRAA